MDDVDIKNEPRIQNKIEPELFLPALPDLDVYGSEHETAHRKTLVVKLKYKKMNAANIARMFGTSKPVPKPLRPEEKVAEPLVPDPA